MTRSRGEDAQRSERRTVGTGDRQTESLIDRIPWKQALLFGVGAFVVGMVLMTGLIVVEGALDDTPADADTGDAEDEPGFTTLVGWLYFGSQFVDVELSWALGTESMNYLEEASTELSIPTLVYRLVPIVALVGGGRLLAEKTLPATATAEEGAKRGATLAAGYLLAVVFGSQLFTWSVDDGDATASMGVEFTEALLVSGLVYPLLFGAIGGYLVFNE